MASVVMRHGDITITALTLGLRTRMMEINDFSKIRLGEDGRIHYFLYQQDGSKQPMSCADTIYNRMFVSWCQKFDSPTTGHDVESVARRAANLRRDYVWLSERA